MGFFTTLCSVQNDKKRQNHQPLIEATSGNTGIALAMIGAVKGYKVEIVMSKAVSQIKPKKLKKGDNVQSNMKPILIANWKMKLGLKESLDLTEKIKNGLIKKEQRIHDRFIGVQNRWAKKMDVVLCPSFTALSDVRKAAKFE